MVHSAQADGQRVVSLPLHPSEEDTGGLLRVGSLAFAICASHETGSSPGFQPASERHSVGNAAQLPLEVPGSFRALLGGLSVEIRWPASPSGAACKTNCSPRILTREFRPPAKATRQRSTLFWASSSMRHSNDCRVSLIWIVSDSETDASIPFWTVSKFALASSS